MLKKIYYVCNNCEFAKDEYLDPLLLETKEYQMNLGFGKGMCPKCNSGTLIYDDKYIMPKQKSNTKVYTNLVDSRKLNPGKYQDPKFKAKMEQIRRQKDMASGNFS